MGFLSIVMTKAAGVNLSTTRCQERTFPYIMLATRHLVYFKMYPDHLVHLHREDSHFLWGWVQAVRQAELLFENFRRLYAPNSTLYFYISACKFHTISLTSAKVCLRNSRRFRCTQTGHNLRDIHFISH